MRTGLSVTAKASSVTRLQSKLRALGLTASEISLYGRFHSPENEHVLERLLAFCDTHAEFQLPDASQLAIPSRSDDASGQRVAQGPLHAHALQAILVDSPTWHKNLSAAWANKDDSTILLSFGTEKCVPPSVLRKVGSR